jgi:hypothetical protein
MAELVELMVIAALDPEIDRHDLHVAFASALEGLTVHADDARQIARINVLDAVRPLGEVA